MMSQNSTIMMRINYCDESKFNYLIMMTINYCDESKQLIDVFSYHSSQTNRTSWWECSPITTCTACSYCSWSLSERGEPCSISHASTLMNLIMLSALIRWIIVLSITVITFVRILIYDMNAQKLRIFHIFKNSDHRFSSY